MRVWRLIGEHNINIIIIIIIISCARGDTICRRPTHCTHARCGPPPVHSLHALHLRRPAHLAPWIFMIDRQRLALGGSVETGLVDIHYVVTWTANQSGLVTLTFDLCYPRGGGITSCAGGRHNMPRPFQVDPFDLESGVWVTCDVGYLCANFSLPRPLCSSLRPDVRDRQTDIRRASSLNAP